MAVRPIDGNELYRIEKLLDTDIVRQDKVALNLLEQVLYDIQHVPTLTPPNEPLTLEQLRKMDGKPVWVKVIGKTGISCDGWCEVEIREKDRFAYVLWPGSEVEDIAKIEDYGKTWSCYAYPPAHIDREAWEPCEWCGEWIGGDCRPREQDAGYKLYAGYCKQVAADDFYEDETEELNYCPICGRPLTEEAWAEMEKRMRG